MTVAIPIEIDGRLCIISSSLDKSIQLRVFDASSHGLTLPLKQNYLLYPVTSMTMIKDRLIACMDSECHMSVMEVDVDGSEVMGGVKNAIWESNLFDGSEKKGESRQERHLFIRKFSFLTVILTRMYTMHTSNCFH